MAVVMPPNTTLTWGILTGVAAIIVGVISVQAWFDNRYKLRKEFDEYVEQQERNEARREKEDKLVEKLVDAICRKR